MKKELNHSSNWKKILVILAALAGGFLLSFVGFGVLWSGIWLYFYSMWCRSTRGVDCSVSRPQWFAFDANSCSIYLAYRSHGRLFPGENTTGFPLRIL